MIHLLLTVPRKELQKSCTLTLDSIRTGFPTFPITIHQNQKGINLQEDEDFLAKVRDIKATLSYRTNYWHHADWIRHVVLSSLKSEEPIIILDGDMIFWENCEQWKIEGLYAGDFIPLIWNDFAQCVSMPRIHTSFMWIPNARKLTDAINAAYPNALRQDGEYCPVDPYCPKVQFFNRLPLFWDTCAGLFNMVESRIFNATHTACYEHLNSAAFYDVMYDRLENKIGFEALHKYYVYHPEKLKGFSRLVKDTYYHPKHEQGLRVLSGANLSHLSKVDKKFHLLD